jgi:regulator of protease activity HflC (stomatin/prohibitin superfamily)
MDVVVVLVVVFERWRQELWRISVSRKQTKTKINVTAVYRLIGQFSKVIPAGFYCICWPFEQLVKTVSLRVQYMDVSCETKTKDNVFVRVVVAVQYRVMPDKVPSAYYKLTDPRGQIRSYVFDVVRSAMPRLEIDAAFASKDDIANSVRQQLSTLMAEYGYEIIAALVIDIDPNAHVKAAMNDINGSPSPAKYVDLKH